MSADLRKAVHAKMLKIESKKTMQETPYGTYGVREGVFTSEASPSSPPLKFVASEIPNFEKFMKEGKIKKVAGTRKQKRKSRRRRNRT